MILKLQRLLVAVAFTGSFTGVLRAQTTLLDQTMLTQQSFNTFTAVSVTGTQVWNFSSVYGAVCNGYSGGQSYANEDWLISPAMDMSSMGNVQLTFSHTRGNAAVMNAGVAEGWYKAFATANYTGNPLTTQWVELTGLDQNITTAWQYISSGNLAIPAVARSATSRIAFRYMSSNAQSATWEIKNIKVIGQPGNTPAGVFKITNWNTEWLGCTSNGPADEALQVSNVVAAMLAMNADIYCLQEVTNTASSPTIQTIVSQLGSDQWAGTIVPASTGDCNQRQGIIYKKSKVQVISAAELSSGSASQGNTYYYNWSSGRFPALYNINLLAGTTSIPVALVNIHAKAENPNDNNSDSYTRRLGASIALKTILDGSNYNAKNVILTGDFNDFLTGTSSTLCNCSDSPYKNFMDDPADYTAITQNLIDASYNRPLIEHFIVSDELADNYVANSVAQEVSVPQLVTNYYGTTSNHLPVSATFQFLALGAGDSPSAAALSVYPNPVKDVLNIALPEAEGAVAEVFDLAGRQVLRRKLNGSTLDVSILPDGLYIIKAGGFKGKFIKQ